MSSAIAKSFFSAWHACNLEKMVSFFAEDAVVEYVGGAPYGRRIEGKKDITEFFRKVIATTKKMDLKVDMSHSACIESGNTVAFQAKILLTSPGKEWVVDCPSADFFEFFGGKIQRMVLYIVNPEGARVGVMDLRRGLMVKDMGELSVAAWVIA